jgi:hypothetical protein
MSESLEGDKARLRRLHTIFVQYPRFAKLLREIKRVHTEADLLVEPLCMMVTGNSGVGKSTLIAEYARHWPRNDVDDGVQVPVLKTEVPLPATISGLATQLLRALGVPNPGAGTVDHRRWRLVSMLKKCAVQLVILDEFQHLVERGSRRRIETVADWIKSVINETKIPFVLVGMPSARSALEHSAQLARRFRIRREIEPFDWVMQPVEFEKLLQLLDDQLPFPNRAGLASAEIAPRLHLATRGNISVLTTLLRDSGRSALLSGSARLELAHLAESYDSLLAEELALRENPFRISDREVEKWIATLRKAP